MKHILIFLLIVSVLAAKAQDSTDAVTYPRIGLRYGAELGTFANSRLAQMQQIMRRLDVDTRSLSTYPVSSWVGFVVEGKQATAEFRLIRSGSFSGDSPQMDVLNPVGRAKFYGVGAGVSVTAHWIRTRRFVAGPTVGYDMVWYRLDLLPVAKTNVPVANVVQNPPAYATTTFEQNANQNLHLAFGSDVRIHWYREVRFGMRVGYQLPIATSKQWALNDGTVGDLPAYRANMLYVQVSGGYLF